MAKFHERETLGAWVRPERLDLRPERPDLRPEMPDLRPEGLDKWGGMDERTDG